MTKTNFKVASIGTSPEIDGFVVVLQSADHKTAIQMQVTEAEIDNYSVHNFYTVEVTEQVAGVQKK